MYPRHSFPHDGPPRPPPSHWDSRPMHSNYPHNMGPAYPSQHPYAPPPPEYMPQFQQNAPPHVEHRYPYPPHGPHAGHPRMTYPRPQDPHANFGRPPFYEPQIRPPGHSRDNMHGDLLHRHHDMRHTNERRERRHRDGSHGDRYHEREVRGSPHHRSYSSRSDSGRDSPNPRRDDRDEKPRQENKTLQPGFIWRHSKNEKEDQEYNESEYSAEKIEEKLKSLQPSYVQCTQHARYYGRTTENDSTVKALPLLTELYDKFESELSTRHAKLWKPNEIMEDPEEIGKTLEEQDEKDKSFTLSQRLENCDFSQESLPRQKRVRAAAIVRRLEDSARNQEKPLLKYIEEDNPKVPTFALAKLKRRLERLTDNMKESDTTYDSDGSDPEGEFDNEDYLQRAGELISSIRKLKHHEKRLHNELWYNDPGQANDGPLCRCGETARKKGIRHKIYPGEKPPTGWKKNFNNIGKMYNYLVTISPPVNYESSDPTTIQYDGRDYVFEGFSILSDEPLSKLPYCDLIRFHIRYTIYLIEEPVPENFCIRGLQLFSDYFFRDILELYDWVDIPKSCPEETNTEVHRKFHFFPRFVRPLPDNGKEILSLCEVLRYLLSHNKPLISANDLTHLMNCDHREWLNYTDKIRGMIVTFPGSKPSSLRVDQVDRYDRKSVENPDVKNEDQDDEYPLIIHFGIRPANLSYAGDPQYQRVWRSYLKLRHLMANSPKVKQSDKFKLKRREEALQEMRRAKVMQREVTVEVSSRGFMKTGIFSDICQHALLLPVLTHHVRYQLCLATLEKQIGYEFKDRKWLSHSMNHPSCQMNFGSNPDHVRNALSNCGLRQPKYGDSSIHYKYTRKRGITTLIRIMARLGQKRPVLSPIEHNERLEFLGDAVVGYLTSIHLFFMFPELSEGALTTFRTVIVNNQHLAQLAERMHLDEFMLYAHGPDLCRNADLRHAMANCFEALMGAIYMEAGLEKAQELFAKFLWDTDQLQKIWLDIPLHPLQEEEPETDRQYIESVPILQKLTKLEDDLGLKFTHIRILAKAFTWRNVHENVLTHGHNQRLEFLGDSICNLVTSTYLFELYPTHHEGHLTLLRATMVNGRTQSMVATELGMPRYVITNMSSDPSNTVGKPRAPDWREKNLADLLEAFVAALYIDKGLEYVKGFMQVCFFPRLKEFIITQEWNDPKSCLQQCCLTLRQEGKEPQLPTYKIENKAGPSHARKYKVAVYFKGSPIGNGQGESIQEAERNAARKALEEYNFPQLEWQRRYVAKKHNVPYKPRKNLKPFDQRRKHSSDHNAAEDRQAKRRRTDK
ncbi:ribonuclease 3-like [Styela clava]